MARRLFSPFAVLLYVYVVYFALTYSKVYEYVYWELMNLGTRIIGFRPTTRTLLIYTYAAIVLVCGFLGGLLLSRWVSGRIDRQREAGRSGPRSLLAMRDRFLDLPLIRQGGAMFTLSLAGWAVGMAANLAQIALSGGISLTDIASRWSQSPVLVWFAASQIFWVPALLVSAKGRFQRSASVLAFLVSIMALGMLGARNLPAKLVVSAFLAAIYVVKPKNVLRLAIVAVLVLALAMGVVGAITKAGIYGPSATAGLALALTYSDSVGTAYNLDRIVQLTPSSGVYEGRLLYDSARALIPGVSADYANYRIGEYLGGRQYFVIDGQVIERSVSLAPTLIGAPYADWGVPGVAGQVLLLGLLFGYLQSRARRALWIVPFLVTMASYVINGVNAGVHNPHAIVAVGACILVMLGDMALAPVAPEVFEPSGPIGTGGDVVEA